MHPNPTRPTYLPHLLQYFHATRPSFHVLLYRALFVQLGFVYAANMALPVLVSNYRVITGKYRRILRFLVFLLRYGLYRGKDGIIVRRLENSG